jgi:hypothetical protein
MLGLMQIKLENNSMIGIFLQKEESDQSKEIRKIFNPDIIIWMDTIKASKLYRNISA